MAKGKSGTVTIACKIPQGLMMRVFDMQDQDQPVMGGGVKVTKVAVERPEQVFIYGCSHPQNAMPKTQIAGGFALTHNVDREFWELWHEQNKSSQMVKTGLIFAHADAASAEAESNEKALLRSNLERLDPEKLPKGVQKSDLMKAA